MDTKLKNRRKLFIVLLVGFFVILTGILTTGIYDSVNMAQNKVNLCMLAAAAGAWIFPLFRPFGTGNEKVFYAPLEAVAIVFVTDVMVIVDSKLPWILYYGYYEYEGWMYAIYGFAGLAAIYWVSGCLRHIYTMGFITYMKERSLLVRYGKEIPKICRQAVNGVKGCIDRLYRSFETIDFTEKSNKIIFKIVAVNFVILAVISVLWFYGIFALIIYSVILFCILRKYYNDLRGKYALLLNATNQMAEGNLNVEITEDLGVFNPFKKEMQKIQDGYQKAVEKEVRSQQMKTELITNVSHDLKTPLTAIITYVNLLKEEEDEQKRKEYVGVLEKKSLRLKVLIEDLFEISKASSNNVTLNIVDIDVANLFKQVKLELEDRFAESGLEFRCTYPEEKLVCGLDSQKTYRIFENLLVNVSKYALAGTRVYVRIFREEQEAVVQILNVSAEELTVKAEDLTERFVRGDASRNTEGSGLGLAIARSFTELQKGTFSISIEGDLFKAEVRFPVDKSAKFA